VSSNVHPQNVQSQGGQQKGYELHLNYSTDLFHKETIDGLAVDLLSVMSATAKQSNKPCKQILPVTLPAVTDMQQNIQVKRIASTDDANLLVNQRLDQVFHAQCLSSPNSIALRHHGQNINYLELNKLVDRIQECLSQAGITPGEVVARFSLRSSVVSY